MLRPVREENLATLVGQLPPSGAAPLAARLSQELGLTHATSTKTLADVWTGRALLSQRALGRSKADSIEVRLGTDDDVFLYLAPFRYPDSDCGLLFRATNDIERVYFDPGENRAFEVLKDACVDYIMRRLG